MLTASTVHGGKSCVVGLFWGFFFFLEKGPFHLFLKVLRLLFQTVSSDRYFSLKPNTRFQQMSS